MTRMVSARADESPVVDAPEETPSFLFSVAVCTKNRATELAAALSSLSRQSFDPARYEVLIVDNGSTDDTEEVVRRFQEEARSVVRYIRELRTGLSNARNRAIEEARGQYLAYTDDDCILPVDWLEKAHKVAHRQGPVAFGGPFYPYYNRPKPAWFKDTYGTRERADHAGPLARGSNLIGCNLFFRRQALIELGGFDRRLGMTGDQIGYGEEAAVQERLRSNGTDPYYDPDLSVYHLVRPEQMTIRWAFAAAYAKGKSSQIVFGSGTESAGLRFVRRLRLVAAVAWDLVRASWRDREAYPYIENYLYEHTAPYFRRLGELWRDRSPDACVSDHGGEGGPR